MNRVEPYIIWKDRVMDLVRASGCTNEQIRLLDPELTSKRLRLYYHSDETAEHAAEMIAAFVHGAVKYYGMVQDVRPADIERARNEIRHRAESLGVIRETSDGIAQAQARSPRGTP